MLNKIIESTTISDVILLVAIGVLVVVMEFWFCQKKRKRKGVI